MYQLPVNMSRVAVTLLVSGHLAVLAAFTTGVAGISLLQASATWDKFRKERDFHRMHHKRVAQEKNKLILDMQILKKHYSMVRYQTLTHPSLLT